MKFERFFYYDEFNEQSMECSCLHCAKETFTDNCLSYIMYEIISVLVGIILPPVGIALLSFLLDTQYLLLTLVWIPWIAMVTLIHETLLNKKFDKRNRDRLKEREMYYKELGKQEVQKYETYILEHPLEYQCKKALKGDPHAVAELVRLVETKSKSVND